jgi:protein-disulfide isomerase
VELSLPGKNLLFAAAALFALGILAIVSTLGPHRAATQTMAGTPSGAGSAAFGDQIRQYLISNPAVVVEALEHMQARQQASERNRAQQALAEKRDALVAAAGDPTIGPDDASVTIVEFFDYQCPYCKQVTDGLLALAAEDDDLRIVFKEFPILGEASVLASRAALAAAKQGKYAEFHVALMNQRGGLSMAGIDQVAQTLGLDLDQLHRDMDAPDVAAIVQANYRLAQAIGVTGTPAFIIGDQLIPGAVEPARLRSLIEQQRANKS